MKLFLAISLVVFIAVSVNAEQVKPDAQQPPSKTPPVAIPIPPGKSMPSPQSPPSAQTPAGGCVQIIYVLQQVATPRCEQQVCQQPVRQKRGCCFFRHKQRRNQQCLPVAFYQPAQSCPTCGH